jgi:hypothetical protein
MEIQDEVRSSLDCVECQTSPEMRLHMLRRLQQGVHLAARSMQMKAAASDAPAIAPGKNLTKKRARDAMEVSQQRAKACMPYQHEQPLPPLQPAPPRKKEGHTNVWSRNKSMRGVVNDLCFGASQSRDIHTRSVDIHADRAKGPC